MSYTEWVPQDLVQVRESIIANKKLCEIPDGKIDNEAPKNRAHRFISFKDRLTILDALLASEMEYVWRNLPRHSRNYKPLNFEWVFVLIGAGRDHSSQSRNLYGACLHTKFEWMSTPKRTRAEHRRLYKSIASAALELSHQLSTTSDSFLVSPLEHYLPEDYFRRLAERLEVPGAFDGNRAILELYLKDELPDLAEILRGLHVNANAYAEEDDRACVPQPGAIDAELQHFIRKLSWYFHCSYKASLSAHVAAIAGSVFGIDVDEGRVKSLCRESRARTAKKKSQRRRAQ